MKKKQTHKLVECHVCKSKFYMPSIYLKFNMKIETYCQNNKEHIKIECQQRFDSVPKEERQKILNLFREGKSIGDIKKYTFMIHLQLQK